MKPSILRKRKYLAVILSAIATFVVYRMTSQNGFINKTTAKQQKLLVDVQTLEHHQLTDKVAVGHPSSRNDDDNSELYERIRRLVHPPSDGPPSLRRRRSRRGDFSQHGQSHFVDVQLGGRRDGFFIESGASDGETGSNSLFFELSRNWTGLLVEANPRSFSTLLSKRRRAFALNACLSPTGRTTTVLFKPAGGIGGIADQMVDSHRRLVDRHGVGDINVTCFALADVMAALGIRHVDYWSLDVEGAEPAILGSIDWSTMPRIDVISVEYKIKAESGEGDRKATHEKLEQIRKLLVGTGIYRELGTLKGVDVIFGHV